MAVSPTKNGRLTKLDDQAAPDEKNEDQRPRATEEQLIYSNILGTGRQIGLSGIIVAFAVYLAGVLEPKMPISEIPKHWHLPSGQFMDIAGLKPGWAWVGMYHYGDMLNFFGVAILGLISIVCYLAILPKLLRKKDIAYAIIALAEVAVLAFAASGIIHIGE